MQPAFREMFEGMKQTADGLILANQGIKRMADAALQANDEHEDLLETVRRLETLVMEQSARIAEQGAELRALRDDVRRLRNGKQ
jgi:ATP-dependent protease HslVU (ClpYQ) ATPase subunit